MAIVTFENGTKVNFEGTPSQQDIDEVAQKIGGMSRQTPVPKKTFGQKVLSAGKATSDFINQNIARPFVDIAAIPVQALAKSKGAPDPYAGGAMAGINVAPVDTPQRKLGSAGELASYAFPYGRAAGAATSALKPALSLILGKAAPAVAKFGGAVGSGAAGGYGVDVSMNLASGAEDPFKPGAGTAIGAALPVIPPAIKGATKLGLEGFGVTTGVGGGVTKKVFDAARQGGSQGADTLSGLRGNITPESIVEDARKGLGTMIKNRTKEYQANLARLKDVSKKSFDISPVATKLDSLLDDFGVVKGDLGYDFSRSPGLGRYEKDIMQLRNVLKDWGSKPGDRTIAGIDKLKQVIDDFRIGSSDSKKFDAFVTALRNEAKNIGKDIPEYQKMLKEFEESTNLIKEIQKGLSLGDKAQVDTAFRKLTSSLRVNNEFRKQLVEELDAVSGKNLSAQIAGQQMSEILPRGLMRQFGGAMAIGTAASGFIVPLIKAAVFFSPRVVGELLTVLGYGARKGDELMNKIFPRGFTTPGDAFLETPTGRKTEEYIKNIQPGLSMKNVALGTTPPSLNQTTLKSLERMRQEVKTPTVSKQYILDLANRGDIKQAERDMLRQMAEGEGATVNVRDFINKVETELLPLKVGEDTAEFAGNKYENINLPDELRGPVANYQERIYESPIKTSAGGVHYSQGYAPNYFAHTRIEDLPDTPTIQKLTAASDEPLTDAEFAAYKKAKKGGFTRRVIEIQSDLFQKGRLEGESTLYKNAADYLPQNERVEYGQLKRRRAALEGAENKSAYLDEIAENDTRVAQLDAKAEKLKQEYAKTREGDMSKLEPYRNTWWERVVREEVKQAAIDGKTKLQFPTGETAMKIEGLGDNTGRWIDPFTEGEDFLTNATLNVGREVEQVNGERWIITDVLGDGKFKAVPKNRYEYNPNTFYGTKADHDKMLEAYSETFDISGEVDTNNPIYKFYEKDVQKYLTNKYKGKVITDPQGVKWVEINVPKEAARTPVEAFGAGALPLIPPNFQEKSEAKSR